MKAYIIRRLVAVIPVCLGVTLVTFLVMAMLPGDPATALLGPYATAERTAELTKALGLDGSLFTRYVTWLGHLLEGDLGRSYSHERPITGLLLERIGPTALLAATALAMGVLGGLSLGSAAAAKPNSVRDRVLSLVSYVGVSTPSFFVAMLLVFAAARLRLLPVSGMRSVFVDDGRWLGSVGDICAHLLMPAAALGIVVAGVIARVMRAAMLEALAAPHVELARARGFDEATVVYRHAFVVAFARVVPVIGLQAGFVLGGTAYIEVVFQWPGLGKLLVDAIVQRDLLLVQGSVVLIAVMYVLVNLATDLLQRAVDPRVAA